VGNMRNAERCRVSEQALYALPSATVSLKADRTRPHSPTTVRSSDDHNCTQSIVVRSCWS